MEQSRLQQRVNALEQRVGSRDQTSAAGGSSTDYRIVSPEVQGSDAAVHRVAKGETLSRIAKRYGTTTAALAKANQLADPNRLSIGQSLRVGGAGEPAPSAAPRPASTAVPVGSAVSVYEIQPGETLYSIARRHGVEPRDIQAMNGIADPTLIWAGQEIRIPSAYGSAVTSDTANSAPAQSASAGTHTVGRGESLSRIARRYGTTPAAIQAANGLADPNQIAVGQQLQIPGAAGSVASAKPQLGHAFGHNSDRRVAAPESALEDLGAADYLGYDVIAGDTVESIASIFDTSPDILRRINGIPSGGQIKPGEKILIPAAAVFAS